MVGKKKQHSRSREKSSVVMVKKTEIETGSAGQCFHFSLIFKANDKLLAFST
jgi:hypothetical protein